MHYKIFGTLVVLLTTSFLAASESRIAALNAYTKCIHAQTNINKSAPIADVKSKTLQDCRNQKDTVYRIGKAQDRGHIDAQLAKAENTIIQKSMEK